MKFCLAWLLLALQGEGFEDLARKAESVLDQDPAQAATLFKQALDIRPTWPEGWFYLGGALYRLDRYTEAREAFRKGLDLSPKNGVAWGFLGLAEYELGNLQSASAAIDKGERIGLGSNTGFETAVRQRGAMILIRQSLFDQAMAQLQPLTKHQENSLPVVEAVGLCALAVADEPSKLSEARRKVVDLAGKAMWAATSQRPKDAKEGFEDLLAQYPNEPGVHYAFGLYLMDSDQHGALAQFEIELKANANHWPALLATAFLETRQGNPDLAMQLAERARKLAPTSYLWLCDAEMGRALLAKDQPEKAVPYFEKAVKLQPENAQTHFYLEQAYRRAGRREDAQRERAEFARLKALQDPFSMPGIGTNR
jgi:tetratricopeptide (TPR) repeat protein